MATKLPTAPIKDDRVVLWMSPELKRRLFEVAAAKGVSVSHLVREVVTEKVT